MINAFKSYLVCATLLLNMTITPSKDQRGTIIGLAGSGKSYLASKIVDQISGPILVVDPKTEWDETGFEVIRSIKKLPRKITHPILYKPTVSEFTNLGVYNELFRRVYEQGKMTLYIDEVSVFSTANTYPAYLKAIYQQGRSKEIRTIASTQRPSAIPPFIMSEATKLYAFFLTVPSDIQKVRAMIPGYDRDKLPLYGFFYYDCLGTSRAGRILKLGD